MSGVIQVYEHRCPYCDGLSFFGGWNRGGWWETRCTRSECRAFFHFGMYPPTTPARTSTIQVRCPNPACAKRRGAPGRLWGIGQFAPDFWVEVKCKNCNDLYHYGPHGRGRLAIVSSYCINSLAPELRGAVVSSVRRDHHSLLTFSAPFVRS